MNEIPTSEYLYPHELEQASNSYLMAVVSVMAGLPLPIINVIASFGFYLAHRKASYFVRWHCIQAVLAQAVMIPFNSIAFGWTLKIIFSSHLFSQSHTHHYDETIFNNGFSENASLYYWLYILLIVLLNIIEFFTVITTASQVRKGKNVRWFIIAGIADALTSKQNRDKYKI